MDKIAYYEECIYKLAAVNTIGSAIKGISAFANQSLKNKALTGAAVGGLAGALTAKPELKDDGTIKSNKLTSAVSGAVTGGLSSAVGGYLSKGKPTVQTPLSSPRTISRPSQSNPVRTGPIVTPAAPKKLMLTGNTL